MRANWAMLAMYGSIQIGFALLSLLRAGSPGESMVCGSLMAILTVIIQNLKAGKGLAATVICGLALVCLPLSGSQALLVYGFTALYFTILWSEVPKLSLAVHLQVGIMGYAFLLMANCLNDVATQSLDVALLLLTQQVLFTLTNLGYRLSRFAKECLRRDS